MQDQKKEKIPLKKIIISIFTIAAGIASIWGVYYIGYSQGIEDCEIKKGEPTQIKYEPWGKRTKLHPLLIKSLPYEGMSKVTKYIFMKLLQEGINKSEGEKPSIEDFCIIEGKYEMQKKRPAFDLIIDADKYKGYQIYGEVLLMQSENGRNNFVFLNPIYKNNEIRFRVEDSNQGDSLISIVRIERIKGRIEDSKKTLNISAR